MKKAVFTINSYIAILTILGSATFNQICEAKQASTNPGSSGFYTVAGIRFSYPKGFKRSNKLPGADTYLFFNKDQIGLIVKKVESKLTQKEAHKLGSDVLQSYVTDKGNFEWKTLQRDDRISKFEIQTERLLGFNGIGQATFQFRIVEVKEVKLLVGYFAYPTPGREDKKRFENGLGFDCACWEVQAHIIASITGESYDSIMQLGGIVAPK